MSDKPNECLVCGSGIAGEIGSKDIPLLCPRCFKSSNWESQFVKAMITHHVSVQIGERPSSNPNRILSGLGDDLGVRNSLGRTPSCVPIPSSQEAYKIHNDGDD
jgi:hypothetical protein